MRTAAQKIRITAALRMRAATHAEGEHYRIRLSRQLRAASLLGMDRIESHPMPGLSGALAVYYGRPDHCLANYA